jgi:hypothetical protein
MEWRMRVKAATVQPRTTFQYTMLCVGGPHRRAVVMGFCKSPFAHQIHSRI